MTGGRPEAPDSGRTEGWTFAGHTSLGVGGAAGRVMKVTGPVDIAAALARTPDRGRDALLVFGGGTNALVSDDGFPGTVLLLDGGAVKVTPSPAGPVNFLVDAGVEWDKFVTDTITAGCAGLELTSGIPGTVGAAPIQNIAAYGQQVCDAITSVGVIERATQQRREVNAEDCQFGYRTSRFKGEWRDQFVITDVRFRLPLAGAAPPPASTYGDIVKHFHRTGENPTEVVARRRAVLSVRSAKSMLLDPADPMARSAGSFFMNPEVPDELARHLVERFSAAGLPVQYLEGRTGSGQGSMIGDSAEPTPASARRRRVPAALLLRASGFHPGDRWGPVQLSDRHVLAVVARPGATATDVWMVGQHIRRRVEDETGVRLRFEPVCIGTFPDFDPVTFARRYRYEPAAAEPDWLAGRRRDWRPHIVAGETGRLGTRFGREGNAP